MDPDIEAFLQLLRIQIPPFIRRPRNNPEPSWSDLSEKQQDALAPLITLQKRYETKEDLPWLKAAVWTFPDSIFQSLPGNFVLYVSSLKKATIHQDAHRILSNWREHEYQ